jgi:hypothetical protein
MHRTLVAALIISLSPAVVSAQTAPARAQSAPVLWYEANYARFKPGMADSARRIIYGHFLPVDQEIGRRVIAFDFASGEWDHVVFIPLPGGPAELAMAESPLARRWRAAFVRREGGQANADAVLARFNELVLREKREIVSSRTAGR